MVPKGSSGRPEKSGYRKLKIFFMSGTGNSYRNAKWIESEATRRGLGVNLALVPAAQPAPISLKRETLLGFVMPTHGFTAPWPMIKFVLKLPWGKRTHAFAIVGRGGSKISNTYLPGLEGTACYLMALLLTLKGFDVRGVMAVDMPANWVVAYPAPAPAKASEIMNRARTRTLAFFTTILEGKRFFGGWIGLSFGLRRFRRADTRRACVLINGGQEKSNQPLVRMTRRAGMRFFQFGRHWRAPNHRFAKHCASSIHNFVDRV